MEKIQTTAVKKSKKYGLLFVIFAIVLAFVTTITVTFAWFTGKDSDSGTGTTPVVAVSVVGGSDTITLGSVSSVKVNNNSNCDVYVRAKIIPECYDSSGNVLTNYNASDYYTIETTGWSPVSEYDSNYIYYGSPTKVGYETKTLTVVSSITPTKVSAPTGVTVKLSVFVEAIQADSSKLGLNKWKA